MRLDLRAGDAAREGEEQTRLQYDTGVLYGSTRRSLHPVQPWTAAQVRLSRQLASLASSLHLAACRLLGTVTSNKPPNHAAAAAAAGVPRPRCLGRGETSGGQGRSMCCSASHHPVCFLSVVFRRPVSCLRYPLHTLHCMLPSSPFPTRSGDAPRGFDLCFFIRRSKLASASSSAGSCSGVGAVRAYRAPDPPERRPERMFSA